MNVTCPHCTKQIELVGTKEIHDEFNITPNMVQHSLATGKFPEPWIKFNNRSMWLRQTIESFRASRSKEKTESAAKMLREALSSLSAEDREAVMAELRELHTPQHAKTSRR